MGVRTLAPILASGVVLLALSAAAIAQPIKVLPRKPSTSAQPTAAAPTADQPSGRTLPFDVQELSVEGLAPGGLLPADRLDTSRTLNIKVKNTSDKQVANTAMLHVRLLRHDAPVGMHLILQQAVQITLNPSAFQVISIPFIPGQIPDLGFTPASVDVRWAFTNVKAISWGSTGQGTPAATVKVPASAKAQAALSPAATESLELLEADWKTRPDLFRASWPSPQLTSASPEAALQGEVVTLNGRGFGATQATRQVALVPAAGGQPIIPQILAWSDDTIQIRVPQGTGSYRLALANPSLSSVVPGPANPGPRVQLGVRKMDVVLDLDALYGGTGFMANDTDPNTRPTSFVAPRLYIGPKGVGMSAQSWRGRHLDGLPRALFGDNKSYVLKREWNQDKNTFYDVSARQWLTWFGEAQSLSWDEDVLTFTIPIKGQVKEVFTWYFYNIDKEVPYEHSGSYVSATDQQTVTIRTRLATQGGGTQGRHRMAPISVECSPITLTFSFPPQPKGGNAYAQGFINTWETAKKQVPGVVQSQFLDPYIWTGVFGNDLTAEIEKRIGPGRDVLRVVGRGNSKVTVYYLEK